MIYWCRNLITMILEALFLIGSEIIYVTVTCNGMSSQYSYVKWEFPQGSIHGPLFSIYINDLPNVTSLFSALYADDTNILAPANILTNGLIISTQSWMTGLISIIPTNSLVFTDSKVLGANIGPIWGRQDPGGPHVGRMNFAIWDCSGWWWWCWT